MAGAPAEHGVEAECDEARDQGEKNDVEKLNSAFWTFAPCSCPSACQTDTRYTRVEIGLNTPSQAGEDEPSPPAAPGPAVGHELSHNVVSNLWRAPRCKRAP